ncbi:MAG TPA: hypothetical protein EYP56_02135 [Planctomycetaceae bacterium]|nr:hypothetical protein [Planctomycetaceae bacterium]
MNTANRLMSFRPPAILLLGPTGSGKTPLGQMIQTRGLWGHPFGHFDFGAALRAAGAGCAGPRLDPHELAVVHYVLQTGTLLEDDQFPVAEKLLRAFLSEYARRDDAGVVLNGLPRHVGQARRVEPMADVRLVVQLRCDPATALARIRSNIGGDRTGRTGDDPASVEKRLALYAARTEPLVDYYRRSGRPVETIQVTPELRPEAVWEMLNRRPGIWTGRAPCRAPAGQHLSQGGPSGAGGSSHRGAVR